MSAGYPAISHITTHQSTPDSLDVSAGHQVPKTTVLTQEFVLPVSLPSSSAPMLSTEESVHLVPASINLPLHAILQLSSDPALASLLKDQGAGKAAGVTLQLPPDALKVFANQGLLPAANNEKRPTLEDLAAVLASQTKDGRLMVNPAQGQAEVSQPSPSSSAAALTSQILRTLTIDNAGGGDSLLTADVTSYASQSADDGKNRQLQDSFSDSMTTLQMEALLNATNVGTPSSSTFDLFDGESSMTDFNVEGDGDLRHDLHLSPQAFLNDPGGDQDSSSGGNENSHHSTSSQPGGAASAAVEGGQMQVASGSSEKAPRGKGRPAKTGPGRHGATCGICGKAFNNSSALAKHKLTHSDERKYVCPICSKAFKRQDHLNGHMMTHRSKKPFECQFEGCDKSYCDARSLRRHLENQHVHNPELGAIGHVDGEGKYYSGNSDQYFQFDPQYRQQIIANGEGRPFDPQKSPGYLAQCSPVTPTSPMHRYPYNPFDEPKPIQCSICQRRFKNVPALNGHMRLHGGYFRKDNEDEDDEDSKKSSEESSSTKQSQNISLKADNSQSSNSAASTNNNHQPGFSALKEMLQQQQRQQQRDDSISNANAPTLQQGRGGLMGGGTGNPSLSTPSQQQPLQSPHTVNTSQSHFTFSTSVPINITAVSNSTFTQEQQIAAALIQQQQQQHNLPSISVAGPDMAISSNSTQTMVSLPLSSDYNNSAQQSFINVTDSSSYQQQQQIINVDNLTGYQDDAQMSHINSPMSHHSQSVPNTPSHLTANHVMAPNHHMSQPCTPNHPLTPTHPPHTPTHPPHTPTQPNHLPHTPSYTQAHPPHTPTLPAYQAHTSVHMSGNHPMTPGPTTPSHVMTPGPHSHPNTPHPHTPSHPMTPQPHTPSHPLTPGPQTPNHPHTPQPHTPSHPLTPNRNKQQGTFFNFPVPAPPQQQQQLQQLRPQPQLQPALPQFQPTRPQFSPNPNGQQQLRLQLQLQQQQQQQQQQLKVQLQQLQQQEQLQMQQQLEQQQLQEQLQQQQLQQQQQQLQQIQFQQQIQLQQQDQFVRMTPSVGSTTSEALESALDQLAAENIPSLEQLTSSDLNQIDNFTNFPGEIDSNFAGQVKQEEKDNKLEDFFPLQDAVNERKRRASADPDKFTQPKRSAIFYVGSGADSVRQAAEGSMENSGGVQQYQGGPLPNQMQQDDVKVLQTLKQELVGAKSDKDLFQRPRSRVDELALRRVRTDEGGLFSRSHPGRDFHKSKSMEGGSVFRNPAAVGASRAKKKHRPEPLIIPPHVSHFGFQSRLRSPRLWEGNESGMTPPPYTPPPMLSPVRSGSGLFWLITPTYRPGTPKSAPITPRLLLHRRNSGASAATVSTPATTVQTISEEPEDEEEEEEPPPETDILPHVNVGPQYQAEIPDFVGDRSVLDNTPIKEELVWHPEDMDELTEEEVQYYQDFACCAAVPGNGTNKEYALHLLHLAHGNIKEAMLLLMKSQPKLPHGHTLLTYKYQECDSWSLEEIDSYHQALMKCDKDFFAISKQVNSKSVKQCIQFYYLWKKVCSEEYKRLRIIRRKREQDELYSLRSKAAQDDKEGTPSPKPDDDGNFNCEFPGCSAAFSTRQGLSVHMRSHTRGHSPHRSRNTPSPGPPSNKSTISEDGEEIFPCKICGKVFYKVKSRNAHMKSHRPVDPERTYYSHVDNNG